MIATRPVEGISLSLFSEYGYCALQVLAQTSTPARRLTILIVATSAPDELFPQLAAHLPHLEAPHTIALVQQYNLICIVLSPLLYHSYGYTGAECRGQDALLVSAPLLEAFAGMRFLTSMASGASHYELGDEATVAERWACACPTLTTIILLKIWVWFVGSTGRWVHS